MNVCQPLIFVLTFCLLTQYLILIYKSIFSCIKYKMYYKSWIKYFVIVIVMTLLTLGNSDIEFCNKSRCVASGMWRILTTMVRILIHFVCMRIPRVCPWGVMLTDALSIMWRQFNVPYFMEFGPILFLYLRSVFFILSLCQATICPGIMFLDRSHGQKNKKLLKVPNTNWVSRGDKSFPVMNIK